MELDGYGPLPADLERDLLATSKGRLWWRRLYAAPEGGRALGQSFQVMILSVAERPERSITVIKLLVVSREVVLTHSAEPMVSRFQAIGLSVGSG